MTSPIVTYNDLTYKVSLFRSGKYVTHIFGEHSLQVCAGTELELEHDRHKIQGFLAEDGLLYYLCATPSDVGRQLFVWIKDKNEAIELRKAIKNAELELF